MEVTKEQFEELAKDHEEMQRAMFERAALAETVKQVLGHSMIGPFEEMVQEIMASLEEKAKTVDAILQAHFSQCPECGSPAFSGSMCEGVKFICPTCEAELVWALKEKTGRYTLVKELPESEEHCGEGETNEDTPADET